MSTPIETALLDAINASDAPPETLHQDVGKRLGRRSTNVKRSFATYISAGYLDPKTLKPTDALREQLRTIAGTSEAAGTTDISKPAAGETGLVPWNALLPTGLNYRKTFDAERLESLAASILSKGVLTALTVRPNPDREGDYQIAAGERRYRAIGLLIDRGDLPIDTPVPVVCRDMTDAEALSIALAENMEQETVDPFEEAEGFLRLQQRYIEAGRDPGEASGDIAAELGCSQRIVQRRLRTIRELVPAARDAWAEGQIASFAMAEELSRWPEERQADALEEITHAGWSDITNAEELRAWLNEDAPPVGEQVFDEELYCAEGGTFIDPDTEGEPRRFARKSLAERLTHDWIVAKAAELAEAHGYDDGPVIASYRSEYSWPTPPEDDKIPQAKKRAFFKLDPLTLKVEVIHPVVSGDDLQASLDARAADTKQPSEASAATSSAPPLSQRNWTAGSIARTGALQDIVADAPHLSLALAIIALLPGKESWSRSGSKLLHIEGNHRWSRCPLRPGLLDAYEGIENGRVLDAGAALESLCEASQSDLLTIFAAVTASLTGEWSGMAGPGANDEALFIARIAEGWDDRGHESFNALDELADAEWCELYTTPQLNSIADAVQADERAGPDDPRPKKKAELALWLSRHRGPDWIPPEARFLSPDDAQAAVDAMLRGEAV